MKSENYMNLEFPSRSANEAFARSAIACFAAQLDPTLDELGDIKTAVSEAVTNCIVHAYPETIGPVILRARLLPDNVLDIMVKDRGCGIADLEQACRPMFTTGGEERSGMGITIMESFMDRVPHQLRARQGYDRPYEAPDCTPGWKKMNQEELPPSAARDGDREAGEALIQANSGLVWSVARRFFGRGVDPRRPVSVGLSGLSKGGAGIRPELWHPVFHLCRAQDRRRNPSFPPG